MICYTHPTETSPPPWLVGARDIACRPDPRGGMLFGIGPSYLLSAPEETVEVEGGWRSWINGSVDSTRIFRAIRWCNFAPAEDLEGRLWCSPVILDASGKRAIRVRYGPDFLPLLSEEQIKAEEVALLARDLFHRLLSAGAEPSPEEQLAQVGWAATLISLTNHISMRTLLAHGLMDEAMVAGILVGATSYSIGQGHG